MSLKRSWSLEGSGGGRGGGGEVSAVDEGKGKTLF